MNQMMLDTPTAIVGRIEFRADDARTLRAGLCAALVALDQGVEPNVVWAPGYRVAIMIGGVV